MLSQRISNGRVLWGFRGRGVVPLLFLGVPWSRGLSFDRIDDCDKCSDRWDDRYHQEDQWKGPWNTGEVGSGNSIGDRV